MASAGKDFYLTGVGSMYIQVSYVEGLGMLLLVNASSA